MMKKTISFLCAAVLFLSAPAGMNTIQADDNISQEDRPGRRWRAMQHPEEAQPEEIPEEDLTDEASGTEGEPSPAPEEASDSEEEESPLIPVNVQLVVPELIQTPELPTGCESVALTIALIYKGFSLDKTTIAQDYLIMSSSDNFVKGYVGDPFSEEGMGIYPPGLLATARKYLRTQNTDEIPQDISGSDFSELLRYVAEGEPVIVWTTMYMLEPEFSEYSVSYKGKDYVWYYQEHCVVLSGYNLSEGTVTVSDPLEGIVQRNLDDFSRIYEITGKNAMIL